MAKPALLLIDLQNDYFAKGKYPLWNTDSLLTQTEQAIAKANNAGIPIVHIQHIADNARGLAPFFNKGTPGVDIHPRILAATAGAKVLVKAYADSFYETQLEQTLDNLGIDTLWIAGMMTQNCVTHTALSKTAEKYDVFVLSDLCTSVDKMIHSIALRALSTRVPVIPLPQPLA